MPDSPSLSRQGTRTVVQYAITDASTSGDADAFTQRPITDPKGWELNDLLARCDAWNRNLARDGKRAEALRDKPAHALTKEEFETVRDWFHGSWTGETPGKDKRWIVVRREVTTWEPFDG